MSPLRAQTLRTAATFIETNEALEEVVFELIVQMAVIDDDPKACAREVVEYVADVLRGAASPPEEAS